MDYSTYSWNLNLRAPHLISFPADALVSYFVQSANEFGQFAFPYAPHNIEQSF